MTTHPAGAAAPPEFIGAQDVAALLGLSYATFLLRREDLEGGAAFPPPLPWHLRPMRWRRSEVLAWMEAQEAAAREPEIPPELLATGRVAMLREARR